MREEKGLPRTRNIQKGSLIYSERAYSLIKKMILEREVSSKEPLSESKLASMIGMSRTPVREALKRLKNEGIIISSDKKGYFLNIPTAKEIKDLYEVRAILELAAVKLAIQRLDPNEIEEFEKKILRFKAELDKADNGKPDLVKLGKELHFFIIERAGNQKLEELVKKLYEHIEMSRVYSYYKRRKEGIDEHLRIVNALKERNLEKTQATMEEHLKNAFEMLMKIL
ncbi:MAG: GntR family transcriptional regulator [Thermodesulfobacteriota bacterium]|nr:GntR family transcriptional regulator [Thermodesulfobacteriota bacterium]